MPLGHTTADVQQARAGQTRRPTAQTVFRCRGPQLGLTDQRSSWRKMGNIKRESAEAGGAVHTAVHTAAGD